MAALGKIRKMQVHTEAQPGGSHLAHYQLPVGDEKIDMNGHKNKSKTRESAFTVYPAGCATTKKAESYSHDEEIMSFQSFVYPW